MKRIYTLSKTMAFLFSCMALIGTASSCADQNKRALLIFDL